jgi:hypothetical protein
MGWKRINGRRYFYKSKREGCRVKTTYFGAGESGSVMARIISLERSERADKRKERQAERQQFETEDRAVSDWFKVVQTVADAAMVAAGFHKHKGQRRRKKR